MGILLALCWPWIIGPKPGSKADVNLKLQFLTKGAYLVGSIIFLFVVAGIGSLLILRQARQEYAEQKDSNLKDLISGTQEAIRNKQNEQS